MSWRSPEASVVVCLAISAMWASQPKVVGGEDAERAAIAAEATGRLAEAFQHYLTALQALPDPPPLEADLGIRECRRSPETAVFLLASHSLVIIRAAGAAGLTG